MNTRYLSPFLGPPAKQEKRQAAALRELEAQFLVSSGRAAAPYSQPSVAQPSDDGCATTTTTMATATTEVDVLLAADDLAMADDFDISNGDDPLFSVLDDDDDDDDDDDWGCSSPEPCRAAFKGKTH